ncbi:hypothetical protein M1271_00085 [Patescibacteria group bacterium]|nr:hypothetical protein [Patescibacteria group bacterium]
MSNSVISQDSEINSKRQIEEKTEPTNQPTPHNSSPNPQPTASIDEASLHILASLPPTSSVAISANKIPTTSFSKEANKHPPDSIKTDNQTTASVKTLNNDMSSNSIPKTINRLKQDKVSNHQPTTQGRNKSRFQIIPLIISAFILLSASSITIYYFYAAPKIAARSFAQDLKPDVNLIKISLKSVIMEIDKIHTISIEKNTLNNTSNNQLSAVFPSQKDSQKNSAEQSDMNLIEKSAQMMITKVSNDLALLENHASNIAGANTISSDVGDPETMRMRTLKSEAQKTSEYIDKAQKDLISLISRSSTPPKNLDKKLQLQFMNSASINQIASPYFLEAKKISNYYGTISDTVINMTAKMNSFATTITTTDALFNQPFEASSGAELSFEMHGRIAQIGAFLNQAKNDLADVKKYSQRIENMPKDDLPMGINDYHTHNIKVFNSITDYFASQLNTIQGFTTIINSIIAKTDNQQMSQGDWNNVRSSVSQGIIDSQKSEAEFIANIQSLSTEENTLTQNFWQNDTILSTGSKIQSNIDNYEKTLTQISSDNKIPLFN